MCVQEVCAVSKLKNYASFFQKVCMYWFSAPTTYLPFPVRQRKIMQALIDIFLGVRSMDQSSTDPEFDDRSSSVEGGMTDAFFEDDEERLTFVDPEMDSYSYEFSERHDGVFLIRSVLTGTVNVLVKESHPVVTFCYRIDRQERHAMDDLMTFEPDEVQDVEPVPGVLAFFVETCMNDKPVFSFYGQGGTTELYDASGEYETVPEKQDVIVDIGPGHLLSTQDVSYEEKIASMSTNKTFDDVDASLSDGHLRNFQRRGYTAGAKGATGEKWTGHSPVTKGQTRWFVINRHYYALWKSFHDTCHRSGILMKTGSSTEEAPSSGMRREYELIQLHEKLSTQAARVVALRESIGNLALVKSTAASVLGFGEIGEEIVDSTVGLLGEMEKILQEIAQKTNARLNNI